MLQQPQWLRHTISQWQTAEHRHEGLNFFCKTTGLSKEYICRTFKRCFGQTPTIYLNRRRLSYAVKRLILSDDAITDIAYEAGFRSLSRFYHVFHDTYGITPRQLRSRHDSGSQP